ncbi:MAG: xanthine dehydrogenase subunit D, partial [Clostridia bacterium]
MTLAEERYIGQSQLRQEGPAKLKGRGGYVQDYDFRNMTYARLILSPYAHARVRAIRTEAARLPGVVAVYTAETLPRTGLLAEHETFYVGEP